jgi:2-polyprenyl-6-methoxyphenol hydroxylase-like FAD-dependent oxidoreductase
MMNYLNKPRVIVVGGSLGGLFAANMLLRKGWDVEVFERVPDELAGRGAGIVTHPELFEAMAAAGIPLDSSVGIDVLSRVTLAQDGDVVLESALPQTLTAWGKMYQVLRSAFPDSLYRCGGSVVSVESTETHASVTLADGTTHQANVIIAADGFRSTIRQHFLPDVHLQYAGYIAWRGLVDESALSDAAHTALFDKFAFCLPPHEQILGYPVAGPSNSTLVGGFPPALIRRDVLDNMYKSAETLLAPQFAEVVKKATQPLFQPIYDLEVPKMNFGRVALLGDAAFVARPHCGMGVTKAAGDALAIVEALERHASVEEALADYSEQRCRFGASIVQHARHLGAYMQAQLKSEEEREMAELYRTPEAVMRETAVPVKF